jgi:hypothetical protein
MKFLFVGLIGVAAATAYAGHDDNHWKLDRPVVSSFWPTKGDPATKVMIRGANFASDTSVMWGTKQIGDAHVSPTEITFTVPKEAKTAEAITLHHGASVLAVGTFEVAHFDAKDAKRVETDRQHAAETAWKDRQKGLAKDRPARDAELAKQEKDLEASRDQRREKEATEVRTKWKPAELENADVQAELTLHAKRVADLEQMDRLATARADGKLVVRVQVATAKENERHEQRMTTLQTAMKK